MDLGLICVRVGGCDLGSNDFWMFICGSWSAVWDISVHFVARHQGSLRYKSNEEMLALLKTVIRLDLPVRPHARRYPWTELVIVSSQYLSVN